MNALPNCGFVVTMLQFLKSSKNGDEGRVACLDNLLMIVHLAKEKRKALDIHFAHQLLLGGSSFLVVVELLFFVNRPPQNHKAIRL